MAKKCELCRKRGKNWSGDNPKCFNVYGAENWNCAMLNAIRELCRDDENTLPGVALQYCDDQKYATIKIDQCETARGDRIGRALWVSWYKNRGQTEALWILSENQPPRIPMEAELKIIIQAYTRRN